MKAASLTTRRRTDSGNMNEQRASRQTMCQPFWPLLRLAFALWLSVIADVATLAERLSVKVYTTADGLVSNRISRIIRD